MTEELKTDKDIIVYTVINDKYKIIGEFEAVDLTFRFPPQDEIPTVLPGETQIAFVLLDGDLTFNGSAQISSPLNSINRSPRFNITFNNFASVDAEIQADETEQGRWEIYRCMLDTANNKRVEGVAEGMRFIPETLEVFRKKIN